MQEDKHSRMYRSIAEIASVDFQRKWCVHGTADEYLLLDELLEVAMHRIKQSTTNPLLSKKLSDSERSSLIQFQSQADKLFDEIPWHDPNVSIEEIVERNEAMKQIRQAASDCLCKLGVEYRYEELLDD